MTFKTFRNALVLLVLGCAALPSAAFAQASIAGVVRDASGAVLPGVTVEAASPALIEKTRSVTTDGTGQYKIVDLRPGSYAVTFTLVGFSTVKHEAVEVTGSQTVTVNADLKVGQVSESITVNAEAPAVDIQSITQQRVLSKDVLDAVPSGRTSASVGVLVPGLSVTTTFSGQNQDVGGTNGEVQQQLLVHGSRNSDQRQTMDGLSIGSEGAGSIGGYAPNMGSIQEVAIDTSAVSADQAGGGVRINFIPRDGGNTFKGSVFATGANGSFQSDNVSDELRARGLSDPNKLEKNYDINPSFGGPIVKDKLWFFASARTFRVNSYVAGLYFNKNALDPNSWTYVPDTSHQAVNASMWRSLNGRITWQANAKNKISVFHDNQTRCTCDDLRVTPVPTAPEAGAAFKIPAPNLTTVTWSSPLNNKLLIEAGYSYHPDDWGYYKPDNTPVNESLIGVLELTTFFRYRGPVGYFGACCPRAQISNLDQNVRASVSYVTGAHAFKFGFNDRWESRTDLRDRDWLQYTFLGGRPVQLQQTLPWSAPTNIRADGGLYAQDRWTMNRLTLNLALRYDFFEDYSPAVTLGPSLYAPTRNVTFPETNWTNQKDITPRVGASYDLFGTGKTALKASIARYVLAQGASAAANVSNRMVTNQSRAWNDANNDKVPNCDLGNPAANGECGAGSLAFGNSVPSTTYDPATLVGWGARPYNWEFSTSVQHALLPRLSIDVGYFRRWYGDFTTTDNLAVTPADFGVFSVKAPVDARLPGGGGYTVSGLYNVNPNKVGQTNNLVTFSDAYGRQLEHWNGIDVTVNARMRDGLLVAGGVSAGRTVTDNCDIVAKLPELLVTQTAATSQSFCHQESPFQPQLKLIGSYTIRKIDVQTSASLQSIPGYQTVAANYNATNADIIGLGRPLSGNAATVQVNLIQPLTQYSDRVNQLDFRIGKILRYGRTRTAINLDLYNAFNANAVVNQNLTYGTAWLQPLQILNARLAKISLNFDF
jgi:hypothetical protein